jgi:hypothetical protein
MGDYSCVLEVNLTNQDCPQFSINPEAGFECKMRKMVDLQVQHSYGLLNTMGMYFSQLSMGFYDL